MTPPAAPIRIGWLTAFRDADAPDQLLDRLVAGTAAVLARSFPGIAWRHLRLPSVTAGEIRTSPLPWLEHAATEKLLHRCDVVLVLTDGLLDSRDRGFAYGAVSRELECLVISLRPFAAGEGEAAGYREEGLMALLLYGLRLLFGAGEDPGRLDAVDWRDATPEVWGGAPAAEMGTRLATMAAPRAEEEEGSGSWSGMRFVLRSLRAEMVGILREALANRPWTMPLALGRYTAATAVTPIFMVFSSDVWAFAPTCAARPCCRSPR